MRIRRFLPWTLAAIVLFGAFPATSAQKGDGMGQSLGTVSFPVSCGPESAASMVRGVAAMHHMMYSNARVLFQQASKSDPECAMALWGEAMTYIHPLWSDRPSAEILKLGAELSTKAAKIGGKTARETAYLQTVEAYFVDGATLEEAERLKLFAKAWKNVSGSQPNDPEAKAFYALSHLSTAAPSDKSYAIQNEAAEIAGEVLAIVPDHPGAHHYTIHALDYPALAARALPVARNYGKIAPDVSHALHMMSHIFTRRGLWSDSIEWNGKAAQAALKLSDKLGALSLHYPHALDYKGYAQLQLANDEAARKIVADLSALKAPYYSINQNAMAYAFSAMPARYALERQAWSEAAELQPRTPASFPWVASQDQFVAMTHFAKALGLAHEKRFEEANAEVATLRKIHGRVAKANAYWAKQVEIQALAAEAWSAYLSGNADLGLLTMRRSADLEATTEKSAVSPGEVLPAAELYGDMLMRAKRYDEANTAYGVALERSPRRFNALYGRARAQELAGNIAAARKVYGELIEMCQDAPNERTKLVSARNFLKSN